MTWSLTKVSTLEQCGAKYKFKYVDKIKEIAGEHAQRGTDIHATLESFIRTGSPRLEGKLEFYHGFLTQLRSHPVPLEPELRIALTKEWTVCPDDQEPWLIMFLDLFRRVEVSASVWDWKTGKIYPKHDDQKELYALGVFCAHSDIEVVTATHVYVDLGQNRERIYSRAFDFERLKEKWGEKGKRLERLTEQDYIPRPQFLCRYCSYSKEKGGPCKF